MILKPYHASIPQKISYETKRKFIYLKGGVRGGKTRAALRRIIKECLLQAGIKVLITRTTGPALYTTTLADFDSECPVELLNEKKCKSRPNPIRTFNNGSKIFFVAYDAADLSKIRGEEYGIIMAEEANLFPSSVWGEFIGRLSQEYGVAYDKSGKAYQNRIEHTHIIYVANSGGRNWLWRVFRRDRPYAYFPWKRIYGFTDRHNNFHSPDLEFKDWPQDQNFLALEWGTRENKDNLRSDYWESLNTLPEHLFKRLAEADDEPLEGLVFPEFDRRIHVLPVKNFIPPPHWPVYLGMDYGRRTPTVALWITVTEEGTFLAFKEYRATMRSPAENAEAIMQINDDLILKNCPDYKVAWVDMSTGFNRGESESGSTIFDQLVAAGMNKLAKSTRDRDARIAKIGTLLQPSVFNSKHPVTGLQDKNGWPKLMLTIDCEATIRELEEWEWPKETSDAKDPIDKPEKKDDHGIDALGYVLVKVNENAPLDFDTQRIHETSPETLLRKEKDEYCAKAMADRDNPVEPARLDGSVY